MNNWHRIVPTAQFPTAGHAGTWHPLNSLLDNDFGICLPVLTTAHRIYKSQVGHSGSNRTFLCKVFEIY